MLTRFFDDELLPAQLGDSSEPTLWSRAFATKLLIHNSRAVSTKLGMPPDRRCTYPVDKRQSKEKIVECDEFKRSRRFLFAVPPMSCFESSL